MAFVMVAASAPAGSGVTDPCSGSKAVCLKICPGGGKVELHGRRPFGPPISWECLDVPTSPNKTTYRGRLAAWGSTGTSRTSETRWFVSTRVELSHLFLAALIATRGDRLNSQNLALSSQTSTHSRATRTACLHATAGTPTAEDPRPHHRCLSCFRPCPCLRRRLPSTAPRP